MRCHWIACGTANQTQSAYAKFYSRSHDAVIRVDDEAGNVIATHEQAGDFRELHFSFLFFLLCFHCLPFENKLTLRPFYTPFGLL